MGYEGSYNCVAAFARPWKAGQTEWVNSTSNEHNGTFVDNESVAVGRGNPGGSPKSRHSVQACIEKNLVDAKSNDCQIICSRLDLATAVRRAENSSAFGQKYPLAKRSAPTGPVSFSESKF